ncbi:hypothetical protein AB3X94_00965 [Paraburkholderia sp. BR10923]|uniref:hypothetical protein n=1 Tax=Paraburkholderia sp. BR10923 TaxID=3236992 RepID=UPI0034CD54DC
MDAADEIEITLRRWCADHGIAIAPDDSIAERDATRLLGYRSVSRLARRVDQGLPVPRFYMRTNHRRYRIRDVVAWLEGEM